MIKDGSGYPTLVPLMPADRQNAIADLVDLRLSLERQESDQDTFSVQTELRIGTAEVSDADGSNIKVSAKRVILSLELEGADVKPGPRFGEPRRVSGPTVKSSNRVESSTITKIEGGLSIKASESGVPSGNVDSGAQGSRELKNTSVRESQSEQQEQHVVARGGDRWEVVDKVKDRLDGTYLSHDSPLCNLKTSRGANRRAATLVADISQRDLMFDFSDVPAFRRLSVNQKKIVGIVMAKCAHISTEGNYSGKVRVSRSEVQLED